MPRDLLPPSTLFHPNSCEPEIFGFAGIWHPSAPNDGFSASDNHDIAVDPEVLDLPGERCNDEKAEINHSQNLLLRSKCSTCTDKSQQEPYWGDQETKFSISDRPGGGQAFEFAREDFILRNR